jgi:DNA polymerase eta
VQQWHGIIAVNYPARSFGVKRHNTVEEAKQLCPGITFVHVETIGDVPVVEGVDDGEAETETDKSKEDKEEPPKRSRYVPTDEPKAPPTSSAPPDRETRKVSLSRYRNASWQVMAALDDAFPNSPVERASVDEAYVDVTSEVDSLLLGEEKGEHWDVNGQITKALALSGTVRPLDPNGRTSDRRLALGAFFCAKARAAVFEKTKYTMSGGVAHNKMLAKLASAKNKPNKQTVVSVSSVTEMWASLPMRSIPGLGGKLGEKVESVLIALATRVSAVDGKHAESRAKSGTGTGSAYEGGFTAESLNLLFTDETKGTGGFGNASNVNVHAVSLDAKTLVWLRCVSRGECALAVTPNVRSGVKSVTAFKSFKVLHAKEGVHKWLTVLSHELAVRLVEDRTRLRRTPRAVRMEYRAEANLNCQPPRLTVETKSKTFKVPDACAVALACGDCLGAGEALTHAAVTLFCQIGEQHTMPCTRVGLAACDFVAAPVIGAGIDRFFAAGILPPGVPTSTGSLPATAPNSPVSLRAKEPKKGGLGMFFKKAEARDVSGDDSKKKKTAAIADASRDTSRLDEKVRSILADTEPELPKYDTQTTSAFGSVQCPRCGVLTAAGQEHQSHLDEHVAFDLAKETHAPQHFRPNPTSRDGQTANPGNTGKRRKKNVGRDGDEEGKGYIMALFAKKM